MNKKKFLCSIFLFLLIFPCLAQHPEINPELLKKSWDARWITTVTGKFQPSVSGVFLFRKNIELKQQPKNFIIHVSADNRYEFFVNGNHIGRGPAFSVPSHWNFETYDIAKYLKPGKNVLAAKVWNWGDKAPWAQTSLRTGLIVQGNSEKEKMANTGYSWKYKNDKAWTFFNYTKDEFNHTTGVGPCEKIKAKDMIWDWNLPEFDDSEWLNAEEIFPGQPANKKFNGFNWALSPRIIPQMDGDTIRLNKVIRAKGAEVNNDFCKGKKSFTVPPHSTAIVLFDNKNITVAYPQLTVKDGKASSIKLTYSEALYDIDFNKTDRNKIKGMQIKGYYDIFLPAGNECTFQPLWNRTYRFLQMEIKTKDDPLTVVDYKAGLAVYPFQLKASFESSDPYLQKILKTGWRTGRMCALENYVDCPYYEQLQYFGDLNVSNPITYMLSGDTKLVKSAILQGKYSITDEGITLCAAPTKVVKIIPFFSIAWMGMINNYWNYTGDKEFVEQFIPDMEKIMLWYKSKLNEQGMLGTMPHWNFVDCTENWPWAPQKGSVCEPIGTKEGNSSILTLQYVYGLQIFIDILNDFGYPVKARDYQQLANKIKKATYKLCWDNNRQLLADVPDKNSFSQHANIFAALTRTLPDAKAKKLLLELYQRDDIIQASTQFQAYFHQSLSKYDLAHHYLLYLDKWKKMIDWGFTTFPEYPELNNRSDCHAWNAYPAYELFTFVCGIKITAPGFTKALISPNLGNLDYIKATLPWKNNKISLDLQKKNNRLSGHITIPEGLDADFEWNGNKKKLVPGKNIIAMKYK